MMELAVVTGASRGFGAALAEGFLDKGMGLFTLARNENEDLQKKAENSHLPYAHFNCDLSSPKGQLKVLDDVAEAVRQLDEVEKIYIVNNAGVVDPIEVIGKINPGDVERLLHLNVLAPMVITTRFVQDHPSTPLFIINISSGAGKRPIHGWSAYCTSKAGLNMFTQSAALESKEAKAPHHFIAFNPGVMDTEMQGVIRSSSEESFRDVGRFRSLKDNGELRNPGVVAEALFSLIFEGNAENGEIYDVSEIL
ncbi:MAG TPA: (S)-benzoin forming benzil reductase [Bacillales bacterium]|nr:(S)-benzoin forming benzil reductase [Bacillales bacterium]